MSNTIYYYCSAQVFSSIIKNKTIWLSDMTKSNDYAEIMGFLERIPVRFLEFFTQELASINDKSSFLILKEKIYKMIMKSIKFKISSLYYLAICFTEKGNDLSQWRSYGNNGCGFSIGFDVNILSSIVRSHPLLNLEKIEYNDKVMNSFLNDELMALIKKIIHEGKSKYYKNIIDDWISKMVMQAPFYKNPNFSVEAETRLIYTRYILKEQLISPNEFSFLNQFDCNIRENDIIAYIEVNISNFKKIIKEIIIGPCNKADEKTLELYLAKHGFVVDNITKSQIPYRSKS